MRQRGRQHGAIAQRHGAIHIGDRTRAGGHIIFARECRKRGENGEVVDPADAQLAFDHRTARRIIDAIFHQSHEISSTVAAGANLRSWAKL